VPETLRIGCGAGFQGDRLEPALILAEHGKLDEQIRTGASIIAKLLGA